MPIRTLALCVLLALAGATLTPTLAHAQPISTPGASTIALAPSAQNGTIGPNGTATFQLTVINSGPVADTVWLAGLSKNPVGWSNDLPSHVDINATSSVNVTFSIQAPKNAEPNTNVTLGFVGNDTIQQQTNTASVTLSVIAPPTTTLQPQRPALFLSITPSSGPSGGKASGTLFLTTSEPSALAAHVSGVSLHAWTITFPSSTDRNVGPNRPASVPIDIIVPSNTAPDSVEPVTITATASGFTYQTTWNVTVLAPTSAPEAAPTPPTSSTGQPAASSNAGSGTPPTPKPETFALVVTVIPSPIPIAPGESASAKVRLSNTGTQPLHLTLMGSAADNWPLAFEPRTLDLAVGDTLDSLMTLTAPSGIPAGGTGSGSVMVQGDSGLLRTTTFKLQIVAPATPPDTSKSSAAAPLPPVTSPTFTLSPTATGIVIGMGAVGAGALVIAARKPREKLLWLGIGLYTRLARPDVLGHPERDRLYRIVETKPGVHFHALQRELLWNTGTLTYHLRVLERHGYIVDRRDGSFRRFYIQGAAPKKELFDPNAPQGLRADVLEAIRSRHGISQSDLALALGANKQTVNYHVKALERAGIIRVEKRGRDTFLYPTNAPGMGPGEVPA